MKLLLNWKTAVLSALVMWAYLPTIAGLYHKWMNDPQYSHGILVPFFSAFLLWWRWPVKGLADIKPVPVLGFGLLGIAVACRIVSAGFFFTFLDAVSLLISILGVVLVCGGWSLLRWSWPALMFLMFMVPLPYRLEVAMGSELQTVATLGSTFALQILGQPAINEGNTILIHDLPLNVAEACSGLRMMVTFAAFCTAAVILMDRHWIVRVLVLASCVPIALATNIIRITATGMAAVYIGRESTIVEWLHDMYGLMMMPIGLLFLGIELWVLKHLLIETPKSVKQNAL